MHNHPRNITPIKDAVHGYIALSPLERLIIDTPHFQRLHFVLQNSATYTAYPSNKNSRFVHSLGVAHTAGEMFRHSINNSSAEVLTAFLKDMDTFVGTQVSRRELNPSELHEGWEAWIGRQFAFQHRPLDNSTPISHLSKLFDNEARSSDPYFLLNTFGIALRICGLAHDIGHLPMSHIFEDALHDTPSIFHRFSDPPNIRKLYEKRYEQFEGEIFTPLRSDVHYKLNDLCELLNIPETVFDEYVRLLPIHERRGMQIFDEIIHAIQIGSQVHRPYLLLVLDISRMIFLSKLNKNTSSPNRLFPFFYQIIASQLDADRLDYTLRDPIESGVVDRTFDLDRLVSQAVLTYDQSHSKYSISFGYKALSVIETFFHNRFLNYRFIVYHHSVVRMNKLLEEILQRLIRVAFIAPSSDTAKVLDRFGLVGLKEGADTAGPELFPSYRHRIIDEAWLREMLFEVAQLLHDVQDPDFVSLNCLIETFLYRKTENLMTLWKSDLDFRRDLRSCGVDQSASLYLERREQSTQLEESVEHAARELALEDPVWFCKVLFPKIYDPKRDPILILDDRGETWEASMASPYLSSLINISRQTPNFHVSLFAKGVKANFERPDGRDKLAVDVLKELMDTK